MENHVLFTAVGCFRIKQDESGERYPIVVCQRQEQCLSIQEMTVWTALCWRILTFDQLQANYNYLIQDNEPLISRPLNDCIDHLISRGLIARGSGNTDFDALYDLLSNLCVIPLYSNFLLHLVAFLKLTMLRGVPFSRARMLFRKDRPDAHEAQILALARQTPLSAAELIKCVEIDAWDLSSTDKILDTLYGDKDTTCENIADLMRSAVSRKQVIMAISNLLSRKQVLLDQM